MPTEHVTGNVALHDDAADKKDTKPPAVPVMSLYRYATPFDKLMMAIGVISAVVQGALTPGFGFFYRKSQHLLTHPSASSSCLEL